MVKVRYKIEDICNQYDINNKIIDLINLLDLLKLNKSNIKYFIKTDTFSNLCTNDKCKRNACYYDIINKSYVCWFHTYDNK